MSPYLNIKSDKSLNKSASALYWQWNQIAESEGGWKIVRVMDTARNFYQRFISAI